MFELHYFMLFYVNNPQEKTPIQVRVGCIQIFIHQHDFSFCLFIIHSLFRENLFNHYPNQYSIYNSGFFYFRVQ